MEMQLYPPGFAPFSDAISCDDAHWCAALTIDSLECALGFASCNGNCEEPVNAAFIQHDGVPTGAPGPQDADLASLTPNSHCSAPPTPSGARAAVRARAPALPTTAARVH